MNVKCVIILYTTNYFKKIMNETELKNYLIERFVFHCNYYLIQHTDPLYKFVEIDTHSFPYAKFEQMSYENYNYRVISSGITKTGSLEDIWNDFYGKTPDSEKRVMIHFQDGVRELRESDYTAIVQLFDGDKYN